jgi:hypothetical protein
MTPLKQTITHDPANGVTGDCLRACVASILNLGIAEVPHFTEDANPFYAHKMATWVAARGLVLKINGEYRGRSPSGKYYIGVGLNSRDEFHACVFQDGSLVHDPCTNNSGIKELQFIFEIE